MSSEQKLIVNPSPLLNPDGTLAAVGWSRQPLLDCNLESVNFYGVRPFQSMRIKRWDYYGITTPTHYFSFTISDIGYLGMIFAYCIDFKSGHCHEETISTPLGQGVSLPRNSTEGDTHFDNARVALDFKPKSDQRQLTADWKNFSKGALKAEVAFSVPAEHESMTIVIPIRNRRFYYNRKINCMPAQGWVEFEGQRHELTPTTALGNLDWGRGVWEYNSFWVWSSASGFLADGRTLGLNLGFGFGDTSAATENAVILDGCIHKLGRVDYTYSSKHFMDPWYMRSDDGRLDLQFTPFFERVAKTDALVLASEVHQMFGKYSGSFKSDSGEPIEIKDIIGWSEEHHARW